MATLTLGQMLDAALGSSRAGHVDFEQLHNLLNAMLLHLGLRDLLVLENGEPLEGAEESPFAFLKDLKQRVEANEKEIAEVRALCQELREEVNEVKLEQSHMAEDMQYMLQNFNMEEFQNMMDELRNQLMESLLNAIKNMMGGPGSRDKKSGHQLLDSDDDQGLIVIGNEITLVERPKTPKHGDSRPASPGGKTQGSEKEENASGDLLSTGDNDMGQSDAGQTRARSGMGRRGVGWGTGQKDMRQNEQLGDTGQNDTEQKDVGRSVRWSSRGRNGTGQDDMGQDDTGQKHVRRNVQWSDAGQDDMGQKGMGRSVRWSDRGQDDMGQMKDEETEIGISEVEALPQPLDSPPEMTTMGEIKEEETKMSISKAPPHVQRKSPDGSFTTSETHPRAPGTHVPVQRVQSVRGLPGSRNLWIPAESVAGTSRMLLRMPSSEYSPCDPLVKLPGQRSEFIPSTPPASPGLSMRLPHLRRQEQREEAAEGYSRRSPMYSGGKHTSVSAVQRMEPLLPDPNMVGMGKVGTQAGHRGWESDAERLGEHPCLSFPRRSWVGRLAWGC
ncbi:uncharacterized protein LOC119709309 isoform X2 [Motacilla alba alba]|uniref:uncharacterized protein LOC119709309 isoform X2 n=1 Tax=Motacilla alba alba TaxID=1094192 RepID=UPI0018D501BF|nr:uncharacterized protein LOC119709309 isoform X2 [Motacilla alba alba]